MSDQTPESIAHTIDYIEIPSKDIALSRKFFSTLFGWKFTDYGEEYTAFEDGRLNGGFYKSDQIAHTDNGSVLVVLYSEDLESTMVKAVELGAEITKEIFPFPGGRRFQFTEPGGSEFSVWSDIEK